MHQPCPFGPSHARIINFKYLALGDTPTPPIVAKNDPTTPITVNSGYRVVLGCLCLESGRNGRVAGTERRMCGDYSNGVRELRRMSFRTYLNVNMSYSFDSWIWLII